VRDFEGSAVPAHGQRRTPGASGLDGDVSDIRGARMLPESGGAVQRGGHHGAVDRPHGVCAADVVLSARGRPEVFGGA